MSLEKYRVIRHVVKKGPEIIDSLQTQILELKGLNEFSEYLGSSLQKENQHLRQVISAKENEAYNMQEINQALLNEAKKPPRKRARRLITPFAVGLIAGILIGR